MKSRLGQEPGQAGRRCGAGRCWKEEACGGKEAPTNDRHVEGLDAKIISHLRRKYHRRARGLSISAKG